MNEYLIDIINAKLTTLPSAADLLTAKHCNGSTFGMWHSGSWVERHIKKEFYNDNN